MECRRAYIYAGESVTLRCAAQSDGEAYDLSGSEVKVTLKTTAMGPEIVKSSESGDLDMSEITQGIIICRIAAEESAALTPGRAVIGIELRNGDNVLMGASSPIDVLRPLTVPGPHNSRELRPQITIDNTVIVVEVEFAGGAGTSAEIVSVRAETLEPGAEAYARNEGTEVAAAFVLGIPRGDKGDPGLTPEQVQAIKRAEAARAKAETERETDEEKRQSAETRRQSSEQKRVADEIARQTAETEREAAEESRAEEFATWQGEIDSKADRSDLSNVLAEEPLTPDNFPEINAYTREELKIDLFIDMWNSACGKYGKYAPDEAPDADHPFLLNGLWLTYEEALIIYYRPLETDNNYVSHYSDTVGLRTNICTCKTVYYRKIDISNIAAGARDMEIIRLSTNDAEGIYVKANASAFAGSRKLRTICPFIYDSYDEAPVYAWSNTFSNCIALEEVYIHALKHAINFKDSSHLALGSLRYLVDNAANTTAITITVHADVYAKLTGDTTNAAAAALTPEELAQWQQVLTDAAAKDITFVTV